MAERANESLSAAFRKCPPPSQTGDAESPPRASDWRTGALAPALEQLAHSPPSAAPEDPALDLEVGDPKGGSPPMRRRQDVRQGVSKCALAMPSALAGEKRRAGAAEPAPLEPPLLL
jgi:hypothetical protein